MNEIWLSKLNENPLPWLLDSNPWTRYRTLTDLLEVPKTSADVRTAKDALCADPHIKALRREAADWITTAPTRNNDPKISYFKLKALADFGLTYQDLGVEAIIQAAMAHTEEKMFAVRGTLPTRSKKGEPYQKPAPDVDEWHASPCNSPMITSAILSLGFSDDAVDQAVEQLAEKWQDDAGWFCGFFFVNSMFKKLQVGCQMAGLMALDVFSQIPALKESACARNAYLPLRFHREYGKTMYYFGRGKKFWTFKYPFVWYNALYLADVLTRFEFLKQEALVQELIDWIEQSQDTQGRFKPTSMFMAYRNWDFANKKEPSPWITFLCCRILKRWYG